MDQLEFIQPGKRIDTSVAFKGYEQLIPPGRTLPLGMIDLEDTQSIKIGGVVRQIASFNDIARREPPDYRLGEYFKPHNYLSILMNNLGYNKRPEDMNWMNELVDVENVPKTVPLDFSPTKNALTIKHGKMLLFDLLTVIYFWGRGRIEMGYILDEQNSFKLPKKEEIKYCFQNCIEVKRSVSISTEKIHWCISDILTRRAHNLCPHINKEYFHNCIMDFRGWAKKIYVYTPTSVFVSAIVDPTILMTIIRNCEIEAAKKVNRLCGNYRALRSDKDVVSEFLKLFYVKLNHLNDIFKKHGAAGFVNMVREEYIDNARTNIMMNSEIVMNPDKEDRLGELQSVEEKRQFIKEQQLDENTINYIEKFVDKASYPEYILNKTSAKDEYGNTIAQYDDIYYDTLRRLYSILNQMAIYYPNMLDSSNKWIISKPFYRSADAFALYNQSYRMFLLAFPDITWKICDSRDAIKAYKDRYDANILLDAEELGDSFESSEPKNRVFQDEIPRGEEGRFVKPDVDYNIEIEDKDYTEMVYDKETLAKILSKKFRVNKK